MAIVDEQGRISALRALKVLDTPPEEIFDSLTRLAALTFNVPVALVSLVDSDRQWFKSCIGLDVSETGRDVAFCDHAIRQDEALVVLDSCRDPRFRDNPLVTGAPEIRFYAGGPLVMPDGHRIGTLCIIDFEPRGSFSEADRAQLEAMAASVTQALVMRRDISSFQRLERDWNDQRQLLNQAEEMAGVGHWSWEADTKVTTWSPALYTIHGRDPADPPRGLEDVLSHYAPEDAEKLSARIERAIATGEPYNLQVRIPQAGGGERLAATRGTVTRGVDGSVLSLIGTCADITEIVTADQRVRENEARLQFLTENAADLIFRVQPGRGILWTTPNCRRYGYEPEELIGQRPGDLVHPDDLPRMREVTAARLAGLPDPDHADYRYRLRSKDGAWTWMETSPTVIRDELGQVVEVVSIMRDINSRMDMEARLAASEARYRLMAARATDIIACYGADTKLTFLSPAIENVLGYTPEELLGCMATAVMHPDDVREVLQTFQAYLAVGPDAAPLQFGYRAFRKDGTMVWLEAHVRAIYDADTGLFTEFQDTVRDVTDRKAVEEALADSEMRYRTLAENSNDILVRFGRDGLVRYISPSCRILGLDPETEIGQPILKLIAPEHLAHSEDIVAALFANAEVDRTVRREHRVVGNNGEVMWLEGNPQVIRDGAGEAVEIVSVLRDITARRAMEEELIEARRGAEAATKTKSDFLANMSHEIRTPLTAILGFTRLLSARNDLASEAGTQLGRIASAGEALFSIVNDVLDFSKLEAGLVEIKPRPVSPRGILNDALQLFSPQADAKGLSLTFASDGLPEAMLLDPDRIRQVLLNLIGNAVKFTSVGGVRLVATYDAAACRLQVAVEDTGAGLNSEQCERLFKRFSQVDASSTRQNGGTGLGLAICKGLVEAMGGEIGVDSRPGSGSAFRFTIPAPEATLNTTGAAEAHTADALEGLRVLVVDDNAVNRELANTLLSAYGVEVFEASDGPDAIKVAMMQPVDVILMDLQMPGMSGPETLARIRQMDGPNRDISVLAFTADSDLSRLGPVHDFDGHVRKPIVAEEMIAALQHAVASYEFEMEPAIRCG